MFWIFVICDYNCNSKNLDNFHILDFFINNN